MHGIDCRNSLPINKIGKETLYLWDVTEFHDYLMNGNIYNEWRQFVFLFNYVQVSKFTLLCKSGILLFKKHQKSTVFTISDHNPNHPPF